MHPKVTKRREWILKLIADKAMTLEELADHFSVTRKAIVSDMAALGEQVHIEGYRELRASILWPALYRAGNKDDAPMPEKMAHAIERLKESHAANRGKKALPRVTCAQQHWWTPLQAAA